MDTEQRLDGVTGAGVALTITLALPINHVWDLVTDMPRVAEWSPECIDVTWSSPTGAACVGAWFTTSNRFPDGVVRTAGGVVTEVVPTRRFAWTVLDDAGGDGSYWTYELEPGPSPQHTVVHHRFEHGPGRTGLRVVAEQDPAAVSRRLGELATNMSATLANMEVAS